MLNSPGPDDVEYSEIESYCSLFDKKRNNSYPTAKVRSKKIASTKLTSFKLFILSTTALRNELTLLEREKRFIKKVSQSRIISRVKTRRPVIWQSLDRRMQGKSNFPSLDLNKITERNLSFWAWSYDLLLVRVQCSKSKYSKFYKKCQQKWFREKYLSYWYEIIYLK